MSIVIENDRCTIVIDGEVCETSHKCNLLSNSSSDATSSEEGDLDNDTCTTVASSDERVSGTESSRLGKDSGIECFAEDFTLPDADLVKRIVTQVEHYFSDENLLKDAFLLKHIRRNKDGYVSLKLVSSFRKIKSISKNWQVVAYSVKNGSKKLEVNESFTKVHRVEPFTQIPPSPVKSKSDCRTILAYNFPFKRINIENVSKFFTVYGEVSSVRVIRHDTSSVPRTVEDIFNSNKDVKQDCAIVEFDNPQAVEKALKHLGTKGEDNWRINLKVYKLEGSVKLSNQRSPSKAFCKNAEVDGSAERSDRRPSKKRNKREKTYDQRLLAGDGSDSFSGSCSENEQWSQKMRFNSGNSNRSSRRGSNNGNVLASSYSRQKSNSCSYAPGSEEVLPASRSCNASPLHSSGPRVPLNVIRQPRGPDGTRGFLAQRSRSQSAPFPILVKAF